MFSTKRDHWRRLDNAAKIFPATSNKKDTRVFRFYCECKEDIQPDALQKALDKTMDKFPLFLSVLRKGMFWFYFEKSDLKPVVKEETKPPCLNLYVRDKKNLLFQVTYYKKRINFEVFHALTDGTGASLFLKELVENYLIFRYPHITFPKDSTLEEDMTVQDQETDSFTKYYNSDGHNTHKKTKAFQLAGPRTGFERLNITECSVSCGKLLAKAKEYGVSLTVFLTAVLMCAIHEEMNKHQFKRPVALMIPVNLRRFFNSSSMLNFFGWIEPGFLFTKEEYDFKEVVENVRDYFKEELTKEGLGRRFSHFMKIERNPLLRFFPLELKNIGLQLGAKFSKNDVTAVYTNLGAVTVPDQYASYIQRFGVVVSTNKLELSTCSFKDDLVITFTSSFLHQNIERNFFRILNNFEVETTFITEQFPDNKPSYEGIKFFQYFSFGCIAAIVACLMINHIFTPNFAWSLFVAGGATSMWLALAIGFYKRHNLLKNAMWQMVVIPTVCVVWDYFTGWRGWSLDICMPCVYLIIEISMIIITRLQKLSVSEYMIYYIMAGVLGLLPGLLLNFRIALFSPLCVLCTGISFLLLIALFIFKSEDVTDELYKKLHF